MSRAIFGAFRLACLDPRGMEFFDRSREGALASFQAALVVLPPYAVLRLIQLSQYRVDNPLRALLIELVGYVIGWTAFAVAMLTVVRVIQRESRYFDFLVAYNWSGVIQIAVQFPLGLLTGLGLMPDNLAVLLILLATLALLFYEAFVLRVSLSVGPGLAAVLAVGDFALSFFVRDVSEGMLRLGHTVGPG